MSSSAAAKDAARKGAGALVAAWLALACTAAEYGRRADLTAEEYLASRHEAVLGQREEWVIIPESAPEELPSDEESDPSVGAALPFQPEGEPQVMSLLDALATAVRTNRDYVRRRETLYLVAVSLSDAVFGFSPQLNSSLSYVFNEGELVPEDQTGRFSANLTKAFTWGGDVELFADTGANYVDNALVDPRVFDSSVGIRLNQPLLRGFGENARESLTQAERNLVYDVRDFELFRQDFSIDVASRYYDLVGQQQAIRNLEANLEGFSFARRQAEALFDVGRGAELDVLRARRSELGARNSLIQSQESYQLALDNFKIFLGLPTNVHLDVAPQTPEFVPIDYDMDSALDVALSNRLDLKNREEQLEDARRQVRNARNGLLPDLDVTADLTFRSDPQNRFSAAIPERDSYSVGVALDIPLQRVLEANDYRGAQIALARAERGFEQFRDELIVGVKRRFRELVRRRQSLRIQEQLIVDQEKNVRIARIRFEQGELPNRDVVEAQDSLTEARNSLVNEQVSYEIARLQLMRDLGILFIDEGGVVRE